MTTDTDTITLTVTPEGLPEADTGSVLIFTGTDPETGENIHFAVDHRPANDIIAIVSDEGEAQVAIESWQIIGKGAF